MLSSSCWPHLCLGAFPVFPRCSPRPLLTEVVWPGGERSGGGDILEFLTPCVLLSNLLNLSESCLNPGELLSTKELNGSTYLRESLHKLNELPTAQYM